LEPSPDEIEAVALGIGATPDQPRAKHRHERERNDRRNHVMTASVIRELAE
jgi:hypothetical protein